MAGPGPALRIIGDHQGSALPGSIEPHTWERERLPTLGTFEILGAHPAADGIELVRTLQTTIQNVLIRQCRFGIRLVERNRNFVLNGSHIYDCHDTGVFFDHCNLHQVIIAANHISYCKRAGIRQLNGDVHNIQITGNDIEYNSGFTGPDEEQTGEIVLIAPEGIISEYTIAGNTIQATLGARGANVLIVGAASDTADGVRLVAINGNVLGSRDCNVCLMNAAKITLAGNTIYGGERLNIELQNCRQAVVGTNTIVSRPASYATTSADGVWLAKCSGCSLLGNILNDCRYGSPESGGAITVEDSQDILIANCQILNPHYRGLELRKAIRCHITGNSIVENEGQQQMLHAIRVTGNSRGNLLRGNLVTPAKDATIDCPSDLGTVD